jgi:hypothetical protein
MVSQRRHATDQGLQPSVPTGKDNEVTLLRGGELIDIRALKRTFSGPGFAAVTENA